MTKSFDWHEVWEKKGNEQVTNLKQLDGFENTSVDAKMVSDTITKIMGISSRDEVLEIGCGAGMIAQFLTCNYTGIDYSQSLINKHRILLNNKVLLSDANELPFEDNIFDMTFAYSVFHYFPDEKYVQETISEMIRVSKKCVFIGDLPKRSDRKEHLLFYPEYFSDWKIYGGFYNTDRFNVFLQNLK